jgi:hypothetical protein
VPSATERARELVGFALDALPAMQLADGSFCFEVAKGDATPRGRSLRYTLIALIGPLRAEQAGLQTGIDSAAIKSRVLGELDARELTPGDLGLALWADAVSGHEATERVLDTLTDAVGADGYAGLEGLELAWLVTGLATSTAERSSSRGELALERALGQLNDNLMFTGLLLHSGHGSRRRFPNFATEIYGIQALARAGRLRGDASAIDAARRVADRVVALQRRNGAWPWMYDANRGEVVEPFEIYSVHQDAMAPMALFELAEASGEERYRDAAARGLEWIWGHNELRRQMLDTGSGMLYRSIRRRSPRDRLVLYANTLTSYLGKPALARHHGKLEVNETDRPYHLGWVLEAWAGREPPATSSA